MPKIKKPIFLNMKEEFLVERVKQIHRITYWADYRRGTPTRQGFNLSNHFLGVEVAVMRAIVTSKVVGSIL